MTKKTILRYETDQTYLKDYNIHPVLRRVYANRGISNIDQLKTDLKYLLPFNEMLGINEATSILYEALLNQKRILIVGDYDVDGATSTALMTLVLRELGAKHVDYLVPNRFLFGYGLTTGIVELASKKNTDLIITVDNGIASLEGVDAANKLGIQVLITDHHLQGEQLPNAAAIVNPNQLNDIFQSKNLAGVGVAFYVLLALRAKLREQNWFSKNNIQEPNLANHLDLVALGTTADLVKMDLNNRILVHQGLNRIKLGKCSFGIQALAKIAKRQLSTLSTSDLNYAISPRLNAAGRLDDMSFGVACLMADDFEQAKMLTDKLNSFNQERKNIENEMKEEAFLALKQIDIDKKNLPDGLCMFNETWHQGVAGILASRIKDKLNRPIIVFAKYNENEIKGSGRSIEGLHIRDVLNEIATQHPGLIIKFGGHAAAAGLSILKESYDFFSHVFNEEVSHRICNKDLKIKLMSDGELSREDFNTELAELLSNASPWGEGFPNPLFDGKFRILEQRLLAQKHLKMTLKYEDQFIDAIAFNIDTDIWPNERCEFARIAYRLNKNEYQGRKKVNLIVEYMEEI